LHRIIGTSMTNFSQKTRHALQGFSQSLVNRSWSRPMRSQSAVLACVLAVIACTINTANAAGLSLEQHAQVEQLTNSWQWPTGKQKALVHPLGLQTISIEKQENKNQFEPRWATAYQYSYNHRSARLLTVDLLEQRVISTNDIPHIHLPLNDLEIDFSIKLLSAETEVVQTLATEHARRPNAQRFVLEALDIKASIYEPTDINHPCHINRCALMSFFDQSGTVFNLEPIINLNSMVVESLSLR